jgi:hypothetical protein
LASVSLYTGEPGLTVSALQRAAGAANDFYKGDLVLTDSSGEIGIATAGAVFGIARTTAPGSNGAVQVELINPNATYKAIYKSSATSLALVGDVLDFTFTAGGHTLDESGANTDVLCVSLIDPAGTTSGALEVRFIPACYDDNR